MLNTYIVVVVVVGGNAKGLLPSLQTKSSIEHVVKRLPFFTHDDAVGVTCEVKITVHIPHEEVESICTGAGVKKV